jgi:cholesterol transport system auxiliary component
MTRWTPTLLLLPALVLGGCGGLQPLQPPSSNVYVLAAKPVTRATHAARSFVIEVGEPRARAGFDTPEMIYVQRPYELESFATNRWADSPARMLAPLLAQALEQTDSFKAVVRSPSNLPADIRIEVELVRLQQNFAVRPSRIELALRLQLVDVTGRRVLAAKSFDATENAPSDDPYGGVTAANVALQRVLEQAADFCVQESDSMAPRRP